MFGSLVSNNKKIIISIFILLLLLAVYTVYNSSGLRNQHNKEEDIYENLVSKLVADGNYDDINYSMVKKDFDDIGNIVKEQITINLENNVDEESYLVANNIYTEKVTEFTKILNYKLNDENYRLYLDDLDTFDKDLKFDLDSKKTEIISESEFIRYKNEYSYQEKQRFLYEMLEKYRNFLE